MSAQSIQPIQFNYSQNNLINTSKNNVIKFPKSNQNPTPHNSTTNIHSHTQQRVSPIRDPQKVVEIFNSLLSSGKYGLRNATIFALQLAIGRRTNDISNMKVSSVYNFSTQMIKHTITIDEHKTGKTARDLPLDSQTRNLLHDYISTLKDLTPDSLLFPSRKRNPDGSQRGLNTSSIDKIYQTYTAPLFTEEDEMTHISSYSARKTYGYNIYTECMKNDGFLPGTDINALHYVQSVFNHRDSMTTLRYIGAYDTPAMKLAEDISGKYNFRLK